MSDQVKRKPKPRLDPKDLRARFAYDPELGTLVRRGNGNSAVYVCVPKGSRPSSRVSIGGTSVPAAHVIYALVHGVEPTTVLTAYADGEPRNLCWNNLVFTSRDADAPVPLRPREAVLTAMHALGRPAPRGEIRRQAGLANNVGPLLRLMERQQLVHVAGLGRGDGSGGGCTAMLYALGPAPGERPSETVALTLKKRAARLSPRPVVDDVEICSDEADEQLDKALSAVARQNAMAAVQRARLGVIPNSVFAMGGAL